MQIPYQVIIAGDRPTINRLKEHRGGSSADTDCLAIQNIIPISSRADNLHDLIN
jgi:hypothetical protein